MNYHVIDRNLAINGQTLSIDLIVCMLKRKFVILKTKSLSRRNVLYIQVHVYIDFILSLFDLY